MQITNLYNIKIANKTHDDFPIHLKIENMDGRVKMIGKELTIKSEELAEGKFFIVLDRDQIETMKMDLEIGVYSDEKKISTAKTTFFGPTVKKMKP